MVHSCVCFDWLIPLLYGMLHILDVMPDCVSFFFVAGEVQDLFERLLLI